MCFPKKTVEPVLIPYIHIFEPSLLLNNAPTPFVFQGIRFDTMTHYYYYRLIDNHYKIRPDLKSEILNAELSNIDKIVGLRFFGDSINPYRHVLNFNYKNTINILIDGLFEKFRQNNTALLELLSSDAYINTHMDDGFLGPEYNVLGIALIYVRGIFMGGPGFSEKSGLKKLLDRLGELEEVLNEYN